MTRPRTYNQIHKKFLTLKNPTQAKNLQRFFKTGSGEYGEGDIFYGLKVPQIRKLVKEFQDISLKEAIKALHSPIHEERLFALLTLVNQYRKQKTKNEKQEIYNIYIKNFKYINNWDLVDLSAHAIAGPYLLEEIKNTSVLYAWAKSHHLWTKRIAIITTMYFINKKRFEETLNISKILLHDEHDLIHKAVGWCLREVGKRDKKTEVAFLKKYYKKMPRTMLRYAIEKFPEPERQRYLKGTVKT